MFTCAHERVGEEDEQNHYTHRINEFTSQIRKIKRGKLDKKYHQRFIYLIILFENFRKILRKIMFSQKLVFCEIVKNYRL